MNQPEDWEYEIQEPKRLEPKRIEPKQIEPVANPPIEDEYSLQDTGAYRGKPWSWATRAIGLLLATLILNGLVSYFLAFGWIFILPSYSNALVRFVSFVCAGLFVCQYSAIWLWLELYRSTWLIRAVVGSLIVAAVSLSGTINFILILVFPVFPGPISGNPWPEVITLSCLILFWAGSYYWTHTRMLGFLLKRTNLSIELGTQSNSQYLIRRLLGWMTVFAIAGLVLKYLSVNRMGMNFNYVAFAAISLGMVAFFWALIIYTQFTSRFASNRRRFLWCWWIWVIIAPPIYIGCRETLQKTFQQPYTSGELLSDLPYVYLVELGFVVGTWIQLKLIPKRGF